MKGVILAAPIAAEGAGAAEKRLNALRVNIGHVNVLAHAPTEGLEQVLNALKILTHRLAKGNVLSNQRVEFHNTPPMSKSATWRSPARSTLA